VYNLYSSFFFLWKKKGSKKSQPKSQPDGFVVAQTSPAGAQGHRVRTFLAFAPAPFTSVKTRAPATPEWSELQTFLGA
jgi:hypothetical protein